MWTINSYTVSYDANGAVSGTVPAANTYNYNGTATVSSNSGSLAKTGYTFAGWNTAMNGSGTTYTVGETFTMPASNTTLYAVWTINGYTVSYDGNGANTGSVPTEDTYNYNATATVSSNSGSLVKTGYTFAGWNTASNGSGTSYDGGSTFAMPEGDMTLYAVWTINNYTVSYDGNGAISGSVPSADTYNYNATAIARSNSGSLARTGYTFERWNTQSDGNGTSYAEGETFTMPTGNVTLYAVWTVNSYTVTYDVNGGSGTTPAASTSYNYASSVTVLGNTGTTPLTKSGYTFTGWNTLANGSGTSYVAGATFAMPAVNTTLYAVWTINSYMVSYDGNGNTGGAIPAGGTAYNYNSTVTVSGNSGSLVKTGYTFAGWNTAMNGSGTSYADGATFAMPAGNTTLYAVWTTNNYTLTYDGNLSDGWNNSSRWRIESIRLEYNGCC